MSQAGLPFDDFRAPSHWKDPEQIAEFVRVGKGIGPHVCAFWLERLAGLSDFRMEELRKFVAVRAQIAPGSPERILRDLRKKGLVNYVVVNRRQSHYRALPIPS